MVQQPRLREWRGTCSFVECSQHACSWVLLLFFLLAAHYWTESENVGKAAGIEGIICGLSAIYTAFGEILNPIYGRTIIPLGERAAH